MGVGLSRFPDKCGLEVGGEGDISYKVILPISVVDHSQHLVHSTDPSLHHTLFLPAPLYPIPHHGRRRTAHLRDHSGRWIPNWEKTRLSSLPGYLALFPLGFLIWPSRCLEQSFPNCAWYYQASVYRPSSYVLRRRLLLLFPSRS